jgi:UDPglucose--hexose-1-phosphate uridylyltransferase
VTELRRDVTTDNWVIVASARATRPSDFAAHTFTRMPPGPKDDCPFCPGNEQMTPPESSVIRPGSTPGEPNGPGWAVRVVPNKFGALSQEGPREEASEDGIFAHRRGLGFHEVIIETPDHQATLGHMPVKQVELILHSYLDRYRALSADPQVQLVVIFRNYGREAGTSLFHPHSQVIATPVVPVAVQHRLDVARRYHDATRQCVYSDLVESELEAKERIVSASEHFVVFAPFASRMPFETWIVPRRGCATFAGLLPEELVDLAHTLRSTIARFEVGLNYAPYNYVIQSPWLPEDGSRYFAWQLQIIPRVATAAGFELGSGMFINSVRPEDAAAFLRGVTV